MSCRESPIVSLSCGDFRDCFSEALKASDFVITDPPYGISLSNHNTESSKMWRRTSTKSYSIAGDGDCELGEFVVRECHSAKKPLVVFASPWKPWSGKWRNLIVWNKGGAVGGGGDTKTCLKRSWELIQVYGNPPFNGQRCDSVVSFPASPHLYKNHPAAKPVALMSWIVEKFTKPGDVVFDPFMGIGATGVACVKADRGFIGTEIDKKYFDIASERIHTETQSSLSG